MNKNREVKFAGISTTVHADLHVTRAFHTSNKPKYAIWCDMPNEGIKTVSYEWHAMEQGCDVEQAVNRLIGWYSGAHKNDAIADMLKGIAKKFQPKRAKAKKVTRKSAKVSVNAPQKSMTEVDAMSEKSKQEALIMARLNSRKVG